SKVALPAAPVDGAPVAVLRDVAGGPVEYLVGAPGGTSARMPEADGEIPPVKTGDRLWFTVARGAGTERSLEIRTARAGECSARVTDGTLGPADPQGKAIVVGAEAKWRMLDASGRAIADLEGIRGTWTPDGYLVEPRTAGGLAVYDDAGKRHDIDLPPDAVATGPLGPGHELLSTPSGLASLDINSGTITRLPHSPAQPTNLQASPDGAYLTYFDSQRNPQVTRIADGMTSMLPAPGPPTGMIWSTDSHWVGVQTPYGGVVVRVDDMKPIDTGPLIVISW
ncbi:MAG: hypothetical protein WAT58_13490, partial [Candidatus Dormiibacterota bacterium]